MAYDFSLKPGQQLLNRFIPPTDTPVVSIITPYYNAGRYFKECFCSVQNQTFPWFEWIIMDDGSTDQESLAILDDYAKRDPRMHVYHKENGGAATARNAAIEKASCDLLFFFDADDMIEENMLEMLYFTLLLHPEASYAYTDITTIGDHEYLWQKDFSSTIEKYENLIPMCSMVRKAAFLDVGGFAVIGRFFNEDWHLWLKLLAKGYIPAHVHQLSYWYRRMNTGGLATLDRDLEMKEKNRLLIEAAAEEVADGLTSVDFCGSATRRYARPETLDWERVLPYAKKKTRVLLLVPHMACGGADLFNLDLLRYMDSERYEFGIITTVAEDSEWRQKFLRATNDVFELHSFLKMEDWPAFVAYYIRSRDVRIVLNISSYHSYYWFPWLRALFPDLVLMDCVHNESRYWRSGGYLRITASVDHVIERTFATNDYSKSILVSRYHKPEHKIQVIHTGIDEKQFVFTQNQRMQIRNELSLGTRPVVLYLCRLSAEKRPFLMLEIAKRVSKSIPDICFLVVGGGPQLEAVQSASIEMGLQSTVIFTGSVLETAPYYACADLFLLCSLMEGLSITTFESLASGIPVVSANVGSQYELVDDTTGCLIECLQNEESHFDCRIFQDEEIEHYSDAIVTLLTNPEKMNDMKKNCRQKIASGFTRSIMLKTIDQTFTALLTDQAARLNRERLSQSLSSALGITQELVLLENEYHIIDSYCAHLIRQLNEQQQMNRDLQYRLEHAAQPQPPILHAPEVASPLPSSGAEPLKYRTRVKYFAKRHVKPLVGERSWNYMKRVYFTLRGIPKQ